MLQLIDVVESCEKFTSNTDGMMYVRIAHNGKSYRRKVSYTYFGTWSLEYVVWNGKRHQVNTVEEVAQ